MEALLTSEVGRVWLPNRVSFLPGRSAARVEPVSIFRFAVYHRQGLGEACPTCGSVYGDCSHPRVVRQQAGLSTDGLVCVDGLRDLYASDENLQQLYQTPEAMIAEFGRRIRMVQAGIYPNERVDNGGKMVSKGFYGTSSSPDHTVGLPTRIALCNESGFAAAHGDKSIGSGTVDVTTNEFTSGGLTRTGALTPGSVTDPSSLNGQLSFTLVNNFSSTATNTVYGAAIFDAASGTSNMYAEASATSASVVSGDTYAATWTVSN